MPVNRTSVIDLLLLISFLPHPSALIQIINIIIETGHEKGQQEIYFEMVSIQYVGLLAQKNIRQAISKFVAIRLE